MLYLKLPQIIKLDGEDVMANLLHENIGGGGVTILPAASR